MKTLLILDDEKYKQKYKQIREVMRKYIGSDAQIMYTSYEDQTIRRVRNYRYIGSFLQHILYWRKSYNYAKKALETAPDCIYCVNPIVGLIMGLFNNKNRRIIIGGFLFEPKKNKLYYNLRKVITRKALKGVHTAVVYGSKEVEYYNKIFKCKKFKFVRYGIDYDQANQYSNPLPRKFIFSGGGSNRDYKTLIDAYSACNESVYPLVIATQQWRLSNLDTSRVVVLNDVVLENFGDLLRKCKLLILSLKDIDISAGHMVMFQAMSLGIPILINDITAIRDYVTEEHVMFFRTGDLNTLKSMIEKFAYNENQYKLKAEMARKLYYEELTFLSFLDRFLSI